MDEKKESGGHGILLGIGILIAIYFFFPYVFVVPLIAAEKSGIVPEATVRKIGDTVFTPIKLAADHLPPYRRILDAEGVVLSKLFPDL